MTINTEGLEFRQINEAILKAGGNVTLAGCLGQRFICAGMSGVSVTIEGTPGNALGAYLNGAEITVFGNAQDAVGDTMNSGMVPVMVIGGCTGSFLGEYQAGGVIVVLGLEAAGRIVGNFPGTGMHGGKMFLRSDCRDIVFPKQVSTRHASAGDLEEIERYVAEYCRLFGADKADLMASPFTVVTPDSSNPYKQLYVAN